jgi:biopolymer transport protein ExbD
MFIITLPLMTHSVKIDLPSDGLTQDAERHDLAIDASSRLSWDGAPIAEGDLPARLAAFRAEAPDGSLYFRADAETRYEDFDRVLADVKRAGVEQLGFLGNERFADAY